MAGERQVAIVTGAASGIGRAMTLGLLKAGIDVAAVDKEAAWLEELKGAATAAKATGSLMPVRADLSDASATDTLKSTGLGQGGRAGTLVNNAGHGPSASRPRLASHP